MKKPDRYLVVELPDTLALVDFIDQAAVELSISEGKLIIEVKATHGVDSSSWDEHYFEVKLPTKEDEEC